MSKKTQAGEAIADTAVADEAPEMVDRVAKSAHSGIDAASEAIHPVIDRIAAGAHTAVDSVDETGAHAVKAAQSAGVKAEELTARGTSYMRDHPVFTLGVAVTAGYLLSRLLDSR